VSAHDGGAGFRVAPRPVAIRVSEAGGALRFDYARLSKSAPNEYKLVLERPNTPAEPGELTLTDKGNILHCESDANVPGRGRSRIVQVFSRQAAEP